MRTQRVCRLIGLLGVMVWLSGCTTLTEVYPKFAEQSKSLKSVAITSDVLVLEDVRGPLPLIDVPRIANLSIALNEYFRSEFEKRGIAVVQVEHVATGLRYSYATPPAFKIRTAADGAQKAIEELASGPAPYYVAPPYREGPSRGLLLNTLEDLQRKKLAPGMSNLVSTSGRQFGVPPGASHRVFILVEGVQVPMSKGLLQAIGTGLLTLGTVTVYEMTTVSFRVGIMDETGEFIFVGDYTLAGGWTVDDAYLKRQAGIFFAQLDRLRK